MVLSFMNGVASTNKMIVSGGAALFVAVERLNWVAALGWGVFTVLLITKPRSWVRWIAFGAARLELTAGLPLGIATAIEAGGFSMFLPAPLLSLALLIAMALPWGKSILDSSQPATA